MRNLLILILAILTAQPCLASQPCFALQVKQTADAVQIQVDRQVIHESESFRLLIQSGGNQSNPPDTSPLEKDFFVFGTGFQSRTHIVNGRRTQTAEWVVTLQPKRSGELEIPALAMGSVKTAPGKIKVLATEQSTGTPGSSSAPVVIEVTANNLNPYVQSKVVVTVKVWLDETMQGGSLTDPDLEGALLERLGEDVTYTAKRNGKQFQVIQRDFAVFPQASGTVTIPPLVFDGSRRSSQKNQRNSPFANDPFFSGSMFNRGTPIRAQSEPLTLEVRAKPDELKGDWWLPAAKVELLEVWDPEQPVFRVGEPVTRTLAVRATGLAGSQIPEIKIPQIAGCKTYPGQPASRTVTENDEVISLSVQPVVMVPTKSGELLLPAIELRWWDINTDAMKVTRLDARKIQVLEALNADAAGILKPDTTDGLGLGLGLGSGNGRNEGAENDDAASTDPKAPPSETEQNSSTAASTNHWYWGVGIGVLALLGIYGLGRKRRGRNLEADGTSTHIPQKVAERTLRQACSKSDPVAVSEALLELGRSLWPTRPPTNPSVLAERLASADLKDKIAALQALRFGAKDHCLEGWSGEDLWQAYCEATGSKVSKEKRSPLPPLYPRQT